MKKLLLTVILAIVLLPMMARAEVNVQVSIPLPPAIVFPLPPSLVVIPETNVYVAPDAREDIFFSNGWWWRPWNGRWYRSRNYNSGWAHYGKVPPFYSRVPQTWRNDYRERQWKGHTWNYQHIPQRQLQNNWRGWEKNRYWEKRNYWGVQDLRSRRQSQEFHQSRSREPQRSGHQFQGGPYREVGQQGSQSQFPEARSHGNHRNR